MLLFSVSGTQLSFRTRLLTTANPSVVALVLRELPLKSVLGHVVISGQTFWMPTRILSLGPGNMVKRECGAVYYYAPGQSICVCYGSVTEAADVNQFGYVPEEDFDKLKAVGDLVYQQTVANEDKFIIKIEVSLIGDDENKILLREVRPPSHVAEGGWRTVKALIEKETEAVWLEEPEEFRKIRLGVIESGAGTGNQSFSVLVHLEAYLMMDGADIIFRILQLTQDATTTTPQIRDITRLFLSKTFNHFIFLVDLGLPTLRHISDEYDRALDEIDNKDDYVELTSLLLVFITRMHRWIHLIFPWHLGKHFPHRCPDTIKGIPKLPTYFESAA